MRVAETRKVFDFAQRQKRGCVKAYKLGLSTTPLKKYLEKCIGERKVESSGITCEMKSAFKETFIDFCVGNLCPFNLVQGDNSAKVIQEAIDLGTKHGHVEAGKLISSRPSVSRGLQAKADAAR